MMAGADEVLDLKIRVRKADLSEVAEADFKRLRCERDELELERKTYEEMRKSVAEVHFSDPIVLDIGGSRFKTSLNTLRQDKGSMLAAMFSGTGFDMTPSEDGSYFIDRDGTHFRHILNYLRGCFVKDGLSQDVLRELAIEVDFYQLKGMYLMLCPPTPILSGTISLNGIFASAQAENTISSLSDGNFDTGACATFHITVTFDHPTAIKRIKIAGFHKNPSVWSPTNGKGARVQYSDDGFSFIECGIIPNNFGDEKCLVEVPMSTSISAVKCLRFQHSSFMGLSQLLLE